MEMMTNNEDMQNNIESILHFNKYQSLIIILLKIVRCKGFIINFIIKLKILSEILYL